jgi:YegS/Rv2252/BmrU family lipid kinase
MKTGDKMKKCTLICNTHSGKGLTKEELDNITTIIKRYNYTVNLYITKKKSYTINYVKNIKESDLILSIGGDGTYNEIVTGNLQRKDPILISHIPTGTANDIGTMYGLNKNMMKNVELVLEGTIKQVDIGMINKHPFVYVAGFGKYINVPYETTHKAKKKYGHLAYVLYGVKEFFQRTKLYEIEYTIDKKKYHGYYSLILISNANRIAGLNNIYKEIKLDDDKFEIMFCNISQKKDLIKTVLLILKNGLKTAPGIYCYTGKNIEIKFKDKNIPNWTIDGEKLKNHKKKYTIKINKSIKMLIPQKNIKKLFIK